MNLFIKVKLQIIDNAPPVEFVTVGINEQISLADIGICKIRDVFKHPIRNRPEFVFAAERNPFYPENDKIRLTFQKRPACSEKAFPKAIITIHESCVFSLCHTQSCIPGT